MRRIAMAVATAVMVAATATLAGCSSDAGGGSGGSDEVLRLPVRSAPSNFMIGNWSGGDSTLFLSVYDTVLRTDLDGKITPGIAEKWEYNDSLTELTLHIRSGQEFSNGEPVDADAVVQSLEVARKGPATSASLASVKSVTAAGEATVKVALDRPDAALVPNLADIPGAVGAPKALTAKSSQLLPVGSGPYVLDEGKTVAGSKYVLDKNEDYWDTDEFPYKNVEMSVMPEYTAQQNALLAGQLDFAQLSGEDQKAQFTEPKFTTDNYKPVTVGALWLVDREGQVVPALKDVRVRRAINMALDREAIAKAINPGTYSPTNQVLNPTGAAWSKDLNQTYSFDVEAAKALMSEAGYGDGFKVTMPSTFVSEPFEPTITQSLAAIGIEVKWQTVPFEDFLSKVAAKNYGMYFMVNAFRNSDALDVNFSTNAIYNPFGYTTPEYQKLLDTANETQTEDAFAPINQYFVDQAWFAPIVYAAPPLGISSAVSFTAPKTGGQSLLPYKPAK